MPLLPFNGVSPTVADDAFVAPGAMVIGDVTIEAGASVWYNAVLRGDIAPIHLGRGSNVQDGSVLHVDEGVPCTIGDHVVIGHGAVVHSAVVEDGALIAMHATVLSNAHIGRESIVGAHALVPPGKDFPARSLIVGVPGKVAREVTDAEAAETRANAARYAGYAQQHRATLGSTSGGR
jgi:gamma-carbonic anhydrase